MMSDNIISRMVQSFLGWRLPEDFNPDGGISFEPIGNKGHPTAEYKRNPYGTNLFSAAQAEAMVRDLLEGITLPQPAPQPEVTYKQVVETIVRSTKGECKENQCPVATFCLCRYQADAIAALYGTPIPPVPPADPVAELEAAWATLLAAETAALRDYERVKAAIAAVKAEWGK